MEEKRSLKRQKELLDKKFDGTQNENAGNLLLENEKLKARNEEMYAQIESLRTEVHISEKRQDEQRRMQYDQNDEISYLKDALREL